MRIPEQTGKWVELDKPAGNDDVITMQVPNGIWAGWMMSVSLKEEDIATFLRSIGWQVVLPASAEQAHGVKR